MGDVPELFLHAFALWHVELDVLEEAPVLLLVFLIKVQKIKVLDFDEVVFLSKVDEVVQLDQELLNVSSLFLIFEAHGILQVELVPQPVKLLFWEMKAFKLY